jgi:D-alanine-D-alanine ligase
VALNELGHEFRTIPIHDDVPIVPYANLLYSLQPNLVFNLCESVYGNSRLEMAIPSMLDLMGIPYTGSPPEAIAMCYNKARTKDVLRANGILTPDYLVTRAPMFFVNVGYPAIVKPLHEDGSLGITSESVVNNIDQLHQRVNYICNTYRQPALIEKFIDGREFGIGLLGSTGDPKPFPLSEISYDGFPDGMPRICSYNAKWEYGSIEYEESKPICPANINSILEMRLESLGVNIFNLFGLKGYARIDVRISESGGIYVIDVNPNADFAPGSGIHTMLNAAQISYTEFVNKLIEDAIRDH